jgi:hypothetical protein
MICTISCSVIKSKQSVTKDSTSKKNIDSGNVTTNNGSNKDESKWYKETLIYNRDTTINHYITSPTVVIREGGSSSKESNYAFKDSSWKKAVDSLALQLKESTKSKDEKVFSIWQLIGISVIVFVIITALGKTISFNNPFKKIS